MAKRKYPSELNTRPIRVNIGDYYLLMELARQHDTTVAKVLHLAIAKQADRELVITPRTKISPEQILMPAIGITGMPAFRIAPVTKITTNGNKAVVFRIKSKGIRCE